MVLNSNFGTCLAIGFETLSGSFSIYLKDRAIPYLCLHVYDGSCNTEKRTYPDAGGAFSAASTGGAGAHDRAWEFTAVLGFEVKLHEYPPVTPERREEKRKDERAIIYKRG